MGIYRKKSLEQLDSPEKLDAIVEVASARAWIALVGIVLFVVVLVCLVALYFHIDFLLGIA